jgi:hypothetical protein
VKPLRRVAAGAAVSAALLGTAGCWGPGADPASDASPASSPASSSGPTLAGRAEAAALAELPAGPAAGTAVLAYSGVGEVRAPFDGECSATGDTVRLDGRADTAHIRLDADADGVRLSMDDVGLSATSDLATGRYDVTGGHLSLAAPLVQDGQAIGTVELEVDCGG